MNGSIEADLRLSAKNTGFSNDRHSLRKTSWHPPVYSGCLGEEFVLASAGGVFWFIGRRDRLPTIPTKKRLARRRMLLCLTYGISPYSLGIT